MHNSLDSFLHIFRLNLSAAVLFAVAFVTFLGVGGVAELLPFCFLWLAGGRSPLSFSHTPRFPYLYIYIYIYYIGLTLAPTSPDQGQPVTDRRRTTAIWRAR